MYLKIYLIVPLIAFTVTISSQAPSDTNKTDQMGRKQGFWIKKGTDGTIEYQGNFSDNHPVGEFKRYYEDMTLKSVLFYSSDGRTADAELYYPNGYIYSKGKYIDQKKEGKWLFYASSTKGCLICEESYSGNQRNGFSVRFYPDSTIAEKINYLNDLKEGEWLQYYPDGKPFLKTFYRNGMLNGTFEVWYDNGHYEFSGTYKDNMRDGKWDFYNGNGSLKYELNYVNGVTDDTRMDKDISDYFDSLGKNQGKIPDPEKTGEIR